MDDAPDGFAVEYRRPRAGRRSDVLGVYRQADPPAVGEVVDVGGRLYVVLQVAADPGAAFRAWVRPV